MSSRPWKRSVVALFALALLGWGDDPPPATHGLEMTHRDPRAASRPPIRGDGFPEGVLALTWDDGPDVNTVELARYLKMEHVPATFFVVGEWIEGISEEPGVGEGSLRTGHRHLAVLGELAALGHKIGNHTENHVLLDDAARLTVVDQLGRNQRAVDAFVTNELRMFRAPGGAWTRASAEALADPYLADMAGPFHWDVDGKDWESSLYCRAKDTECEAGPIPGRTRVRADVVALRYADQAKRAGRGIVLLHDRVGHVGSRYALDVAHRLVPELKARGFVFAAPQLEFGTVARRLTLPRASGAGRTFFADLDGDGHADLCRVDGTALTCAREEMRHDASGVARASFAVPSESHVANAEAIAMGDIDGDRRADLCTATADTVDCAVSAPNGFGPPKAWSTALGSASLRLADVDGDGRADACVRRADAIVCATSTGRGSFATPRPWLASAPGGPTDRLELADVDGDGRADFCALGGSAITCALSDGHRFGPPKTWSAPGDVFSGIRLGDVNGDGRADVCASGRDAVACALSDGHAFKHASAWSSWSPSSSRAKADVLLADLDGDGRVDLCFVENDEVDCGMAP